MGEFWKVLTIVILIWLKVASGVQIIKTLISSFKVASGGWDFLGYENGFGGTEMVWWYRYGF